MTRLSCLVFFTAATVSFVSPQAQVAAHPQSAAAGQMTLHVTVNSRSGKPVDGLTAADFTLLDNKKQQPITSLREVKNQPTKIVVVLDAVNLPYTAVSFARQELSQFFSANGGKLAQPTTLGILQDSGMRIQPTFTTDGNALRSSLDHFAIGLRELRRSTGVYGAEERLQISLTTMKALVAQLPKDGPKRIVWVSGGWPLLGGPSVELNPSKRGAVFGDLIALVTELQRGQIVVDSVNPLGASQDVAATDYYQNFQRAPRSSHDVELGNLGLQLLAIDSGGLILNGSNDVAGLVNRAVQQTEECYEISFIPSPGEHDNEYHDLQLKVNRLALTAHTTTGYYARPVYPSLEKPQLTPGS
jgi:VWFA-related protein